MPPAGLASKPVAQACQRVGGVLVQQPVELGDHAADGSGASAGVAATVNKHEAVVDLAALVVIVGDVAEVANVLRDDRTLLGLGQRENIRVRATAELSVLDHRICIASARTELLGDHVRVHLVEPKLHGSGERCLRALPRSVLACGLLVVQGDPLVDLLTEVAVVAQGHVDLRV
jgi:hypothetical protein